MRLVAGRLHRWGAHPLLFYLAGMPVLAALGSAAVALLTGDMVVGRITGRPPMRSGLRQLALGGVTVTATFAVGSLIGGGVYALERIGGSYAAAPIQARLPLWPWARKLSADPGSAVRAGGRPGVKHLD